MQVSSCGVMPITLENISTNESKSTCTAHTVTDCASIFKSLILVSVTDLPTPDKGKSGDP